MGIAKEFIRGCFNLTPYEIRRRRKQARVLPTPTFENIQLALAYYLKTNRNLTFVQVGACDGVSGDPICGFIKQGKLNAVLVEPIASCFVKLEQTYRGVPNVRLVQAAIGSQDGEVTLYKVKEGATSIASFWSAQLASFSKTLLNEHGVAEHEIEPVKVRCLTLASLVRELDLGAIDILQVDTEGFDSEIVKMALRLPVIPECINFENTHLDDKKQNEVFSLLAQHGYSWTHDDWNTLALNKRLTDRWTQSPAAIHE
jgi:FkbM family methyltransferase